MRCIDAPSMPVIDSSYSHYLDPMASEQWKNDVAYAMTPFKIISWPIGVWPLQVYNVYSFIRCVLGTLSAALMVVMPSIEIYLGCTNTETNVDCLMLICCGILGMVKTIWFRIYARNLTNNYGSAVNDYLTIENTRERAIMRKHAFMGRFLLCLILGFAYISCVIYALIPLLDDDEIEQVNITNEDITLEYPMPSKCTIKYLNTSMNMYRIFCLIETIALILASTTNHGNDALFLNITLHVCGQIKILKNNFLNFDTKSPEIYDRFTVLIKRHNYLIKLTRELAEIISFVLLVELFIISILLCIMGLQLILALKVNNIIMIGKSLTVLITFLIQLTLYGIIGNYLKSQMEEIGLAVYQSAWYNFPAKLTRHLVFIIMRSDSPVTLQAGNFIVVNLATYMSILKASLSYLSVLRVLVET
ncbi:odorant receptor 13a-like [Pogonomyrmex barbatus]|uniref:Odorant receptor n=1 Tax=Pogonomyrmex barbatus TaxID=144034 RepID=A0A8N1S9G9_9HYME|nr:odorant receptor 13a-like [Pogonomyrmex barbatus]